MNKNKKGFTIIELLVIIAIIGILVTIVFVDLLSAKKKAQDNSAFTSFKSVAAPAFMCLSSGVPGVQLTDPESTAGTVSVCSPPEEGISAWPDFSKYGWSNTLSASLSDEKGFYWCDVNYNSDTAPSTIGAYSNGSLGGTDSAGNFCFMLKNGDKYIWCTVTGCYKQGF